jgi:hypothetical protein
LRISGHAIIEARAQRNQQVAVIDRIIRECRAVHAEHAHRQPILGVDRADAHQSRDHRHLKLAREFAQACDALPLITPPPA